MLGRDLLFLLSFRFFLIGFVSFLGPKFSSLLVFPPSKGECFKLEERATHKQKAVTTTPAITVRGRMLHFGDSRYQDS